ncbi:hypothetical protein C4H11_08755 [Bacteroides zoogleoformans]|uniref:Uncharacterized protein n=1 Tax=Bacteroides zoogleoformans TaxID=28119 RepID=A0ABM6T8K9_9BACE|nr:hypothetical protein C4H11_08755 [Bacteroides zoogleoformans]
MYIAGAKIYIARRKIYNASAKIEFSPVGGECFQAGLIIFRTASRLLLIFATILHLPVLRTLFFSDRHR